MKILLALSALFFFSPTTHEVKRLTDANGAVAVLSSTACSNSENCDIILTKFTTDRKQEWSTVIGGTSWDKAVDVVALEDGGFAVLGNTSSYGVGNYDFYLVRLSDEGKILWSETFGNFYNDYGKSLKLLDNGNLQFTGQQQSCPEYNNFSNCEYEIITVEVTIDGEEVLEEVETT